MPRTVSRKASFNRASPTPIAKSSMRFTQPPLTAVDQPIAATASRAVELLIDAKKGQLPTEPVRVKGELVVRGSTGPAPA